MLYNVYNAHFLIYPGSRLISYNINFEFRLAQGLTLNPGSRRSQGFTIRFLKTYFTSCNFYFECRLAQGLTLYPGFRRSQGFSISRFLKTYFISCNIYFE